MNINTPTSEGKKPHAIDVAVGANVKRIRNDQGISQEKLAEALGITFQQIQKYEKGTNRISASKLVMIAAALNSTVFDLFKGIGVTEGEIETPEPEDPRVHKATRIFKEIPSDKMDHALAVLATFTKA